MFAAYLSVTIIAICANGFSGVAALARLKPIVPAMARAGVPASWLIFPIGTLKTAGAIGLFLGLLGVPLIGTMAAVGLIAFFICAVYTHLLTRDYSAQLALGAGFFLPLPIATLALDRLAHP